VLMVIEPCRRLGQAAQETREAHVRPAVD
jgi:hypothetical protein